MKTDRWDAAPLPIAGLVAWLCLCAAAVGVAGMEWLGLSLLFAAPWWLVVRRVWSASSWSDRRLPLLLAAIATIALVMGP